jgi:hypothetical protein
MVFRGLKSVRDSDVKRVGGGCRGQVGRNGGLMIDIPPLQPPAAAYLGLIV